LKASSALQALVTSTPDHAPVLFCAATSCAEHTIIMFRIANCFVPQMLLNVGMPSDPLEKNMQPTALHRPASLEAFKQ
jgi:hypothetical protein